MCITMSSDGTHLAAVESDNSAYGTEPGDIWTSTNSGATWTDQSAVQGNSAIKNREWTCIASNADGTHLVAADRGLGPGQTSNPGDIFISTNSGANWTDQSIASGNSALQEQYWGFVVSSSDGTQLVAGNIGGNYDGSGWSGETGDIWISTNSGGSWTNKTTSNSVMSGQYWCSGASSSDGTHIVAGDSGYGKSVWISTNVGASWAFQNNPNSVLPTYFVCHSIASSTDGTHLVATNGSDIWTGILQ